MATPYVTDESDGHAEHERFYENKYVKFFKSKPDLPPGMSPEDAAQARQQQGAPARGESECAAGLSKTAKRNLKRKEKRKQQQDKGSGEEGCPPVEALGAAVEKIEISGGGGGGDSAPQQNSTPPAQPEGAQTAAAASEKAKKIKNLRKKLRQVEELQQKLDSGEIKQPTKEQLEKLRRAQGLEAELRELERDS
nr:PREDICTED: partner of Y14 and mago [Lepisosteus oculatus]